MSTGQMMLALGAVILLSFLILRFNGTSFTAQEMTMDSKMGILAISVANSYIDVAKKKAFDEVVMDTTKPSILLSDLTSSLGKEAGEVYPDFDDFDDYNLPVGEVIVDTTTLINPSKSASPTPFYITSKVYYVTSANPNAPAMVKTWNKKLEVKVWCDGLVDTIRMSTVSSMW